MTTPLINHQFQVSSPLRPDHRAGPLKEFKTKLQLSCLSIFHKLLYAQSNFPIIYIFTFQKINLNLNKQVCLLNFQQGQYIHLFLANQFLSGNVKVHFNFSTILCPETLHSIASFPLIFFQFPMITFEDKINQV